MHLPLSNKYTQDILKKFGMKNVKPIKTPMGTNGHLDLNTRGKSVEGGLALEIKVPCKVS
jgi:hypothetical protein